MDAVKFVKVRRRMFDAGENSEYGLFDMDTRAEDVVKEVEEWSAAHPCKTRQSVFLAQWPEAEIDKFGILVVCPKRISADCRKKYDDCGDRLCPDCRQEFWMQEVE